MLHQTKKQKKSNTTENGEGSNGEVSQSNVGNGDRELMIYRKIYEGQDGVIGFEAYKARLAKARKLERQRELELRANELVSVSDSGFKIIYEKGPAPSRR